MYLDLKLIKSILAQQGQVDTDGHVHHVFLLRQVATATTRLSHDRRRATPAQVSRFGMLEIHDDSCMITYALHLPLIFFRFDI